MRAAGKLVAAGNAGSDFALARYNPDGSLDAGFGVGSMVITGFPGVFLAEAHAVAVQADGRIAAAGHAGTAAFAWPVTTRTAPWIPPSAWTVW